jgi:hypothetical protein
MIRCTGSLGHLTLSLLTSDHSVDLLSTAYFPAGTLMQSAGSVTSCMPVAGTVLEPECDRPLMSSSARDGSAIHG